MQQKIWLTWNKTAYPIVWNNNTYTWEEVAVVIEIGQQLGPGWFEPPRKIGYTGASGPLDDLKEKVPKEKLDFFIKVVCKVNNVDYEIRKMRKTKPIVSVKEIQKTLDKITSVKVSVIQNDISCLFSKKDIYKK